MLTIAETELPRAAFAFTSPNRLLRRAVDGVLGSFLGEPKSRKKTTNGGEQAMVLEYRIHDFEDAGHPGYDGIAIALLVDRKLYVVNGILTSKDPRAKAKQSKLLNSLRVHK